MQENFDRRAERIARRVRIGVRLVLYPLALGLIALAWHHRHGQVTDASAIDKPVDNVSWRGTTSQLRAIQASSSHGFLTYLDTYLLETCSDGSTYTQHWYPAQHRFSQHGDELRGRQTESSRTYSGEPSVIDIRMQAHIGAHPHGIIRAQATITRRSGAVTCASGPVAFALHH